MRIRFVVAMLALLRSSAPAMAQTRTVTGTVTDAQSGEPLDGARVAVRGTTLAVTTGSSGTFTIVNVPAGAVTISVRRIGYRPNGSGRIVCFAGRCWALLGDLARVAARGEFSSWHSRWPSGTKPWFSLLARSATAHRRT